MLFKRISTFRLAFIFFFFNDTATTEIYTLSLHDALPICSPWWPWPRHILRRPARVPRMGVFRGPLSVFLPFPRRGHAHVLDIEISNSHTATCGKERSPMTHFVARHPLRAL